MKTHTIPREVGIDREVSAAGFDYYAFIELEVEFDSEAEPRDITITQCEVSHLNGDMLPWCGDSGKLEEVIIEDKPELSKMLNDLLWQEVRDYASDNASDIARDVEDDYEEGMSLWNSDD